MKVFITYAELKEFNLFIIFCFGFIGDRVYNLPAVPVHVHCVISRSNLRDSVSFTNIFEIDEWLRCVVYVVNIDGLSSQVEDT